MPQDRQPAAGVLFVTAMVAVTLTGPLSIHAVVPALPVIQRAFAIDPATAQLALSVTLVAMAAATLFYGPLSDRHGRRPVLLAGLGLFVAGTAACAAAGDIATLIAGRFIQAAGGGCGLVLARAMARDVYGDDRLVKVMAYLTMAYVMGPMLAPAVGGALADGFGWRSIFYMALAGGGAIIILVAVATHETAPRRAGAGGLHLLVHGYARLIRHKRFLGYALHGGFVAASFFAYITAASFLMREVLGRSAAEYGLWFLLLPLAYLSGNFIAGRLGGRMRIEAMVAIGGAGALAVAAGFALAVAILPLDPLLLFVPGIVGSVFQGVSMPNAQSGAIMVDAELTGTASGAVMFVHLLLGAAGVQVMGVFADGTALPMAAVFLAFCTLSLIAGLVPLLVPAPLRRSGER